jgi:hypothetical protein
MTVSMDFAKCDIFQEEYKHLTSHTVLRIEQRDEIHSIVVIQGIAWITKAPADGDLLLSAGDHLILTNGWPWVLQALDEVTLLLRKRRSLHNQS